MADNAIIKIMPALLKHQVKKGVGDETLGVLGKELAGIGGDKVDGHLSSWLGNKKNEQELEKAALYAHGCFQKNIDNANINIICNRSVGKAIKMAIKNRIKKMINYEV